MDIKQRQYVLTVADKKNFTKAAEELHIAQPSLSAQIASIESEVGAKLFNRTTHSVTLTTAGEEFCDYANKLFVEWLKFQKGVSHIQETHAVPVRVGLSFRAQCSPIVGDIISFFADNSVYDVTYEENSSKEVLSQLEKGTLDVAFLRVPLDGAHSHYQEITSMDYLLEERNCVIMANDHPLADRDELSFYSLQGCKMIVPLEGNNEENVLKDISARFGLEPFDVIRANNLNTTILLVKNRSGIILGPESMAEHYGLTAVPLNPCTTGFLGIVYLKSNTSKFIKRFREYLL